MQIFINPEKGIWPELIRRPAEEDESVLETVKSVLRDVQSRGDEALREYSQKFDNFEAYDFKVSQDEINASEGNISSELISALDLALKNIGKFHKSQEEKSIIVETSPGVRCWRSARAIEKIGLYIPSGSAPLFSTVLMLGVPAKIAGCSDIILCTPPYENNLGLTIHPAISYCCKLLGISQVYALGGAQAIAAMAYGTASVPKVNKIYGPGNRFVTAAKKLVSMQGIAIDIPAGPSELLVIADQTANPEFVACDLLSQLEHGEDSQVILLTNQKDFLDQILSALDGQITRLDRQQIARTALEKSNAIVFDSLQDAVAFSNCYAPEHLILAVREPHRVSEHIINAGSVFLGNFTPESAGDYASGTNHTLPTGGFAATLSGVSLDSFVKKITFQEISEQGLQTIAGAVETMAEAEGLDAHREAVRIRLK